MEPLSGEVRLHGTAFRRGETEISTFSRLVKTLLIKLAIFSTLGRRDQACCSYCSSSNIIFLSLLVVCILIVVKKTS